MHGTAREIYVFPSGQLLPEHSSALGVALARLWPDRAWPAAVVLQRHGEPTQTPHALGARAYDDSQAQGVLSYASAHDLIANVHALWLNSDPELLLLHRDEFAQVVAHAGQYCDGELTPGGARNGSGWLARLQQSVLAERYAPLVAHRADGRCFAIERAS